MRERVKRLIAPKSQLPVGEPALHCKVRSLCWICRASTFHRWRTSYTV